MSEVWEFLSKDEQDPFKRGMKFEKYYVKKYLQNHYLFKTIYEKVLTWDEWENRPYKKDIGIDLICIGFNKKITAVQAKAYNPNSTISKPDIDSFITASNSNLFSYRLLIGTTNKIGSNAKDIINNETRIPFQTHLLSDLEESDFVNFCKSNFKKEIFYQKLNKFEHQKTAINKTYKHFETFDKGQLIMACGTGKTLTSVWIAEKMNSKKTLFLAPSISLLSQSLNVWLKNSKNRNTNFLVVCSDNTASSIDGEEYVSDFDFQSTTNPIVISEFLKSNSNFVIFSTYQSSKIVQTESNKNKINFDIAICDEAHRLAGKVDPKYGCILEKNFPVSKTLFMTATPGIIPYGLKAAAKGRDLELISMDDENVFGKEIYELTLGEAIDRGLLADYKIILTGISNQQINNKEFVSLDDNTIDLSTYAKAISLKDTIEKYKLKKIITFHNYVNSAKIFSELLNYFKISANYISGKHSVRERKSLTKKLDSDFNKVEILSNARVLSEGIDVPELDGIAFIDPKTSVIDIIQAVGRAIRSSKNRDKTGYIIIPLFYDDTNKFEMLKKTIIAMRSHDARMAAILDNFRFEMGKATNLSNKKLPNLIIDIPSYFNSEMKIDMFTEIVNAVTESWYFWLGLLENYFNKYGHTNVPVEHHEGEFFLGKWVSHQRNAFTKGALSKTRIDKIYSVDPNFSFVPRSDKFFSDVDLIKEFLVIHQRMPLNVEKYKGNNIGNTVSNFAKRRNRGELEEYKIKELDKLKKYGFVWNKNDEIFEQNFKDIISFSKREGHTYPKQNHIESEGGRFLGNFVNNIRTAFDKTHKVTTELSPEKIKRFNEEVPNWSWDKELTWKSKQNIIFLEQFLQSNCFYDLNNKTSFNNWNIGQFYYSQIYNTPKNSYTDQDKLKNLKDKYGIKIYKKNKLFNYGSNDQLKVEYTSKLDSIYNKNKISNKDIDWLNEQKNKYGKKLTSKTYEYHLLNVLFKKSE